MAQRQQEREEEKKPHIKKPLNAFMLYMREERPKVVAQCKVKESATINQILGQRVSLRVCVCVCVTECSIFMMIKFSVCYIFLNPSCVYNGGRIFCCSTVKLIVQNVAVIKISVSSYRTMYKMMKRSLFLVVIFHNQFTVF